MGMWKGKTSKRRPQYVSDEELQRRWALAFSNKNKENVDDEHASVSTEGEASDRDAAEDVESH